MATPEAEVQESDAHQSQEEGCDLRVVVRQGDQADPRESKSQRGGEGGGEGEGQSESKTATRCKSKLPPRIDEVIGLDDDRAGAKARLGAGWCR